MTLLRLVPIALVVAIAASCGEAHPPQPGQPMSADDFRRELLGMPLCGTPKAGTLAGKLMCTVHLADGTAVLAGAGMLARGFWDTDGRHICRRDALDPPDRRRCVDYERLAGNRYRNSDGVEFCIGPCA
jgi:hypothetical protein